jgi:hypothetical protein
MAKLCNAAPAFFRAALGDGTEFHPPRRYSPLAELTLLRGACLVPAEIRHRRGGAKQVLTGPSSLRFLASTNRRNNVHFPAKDCAY